ncbi:MAG TPA: S8 family serine peptidase, partial [Longimicrobium sp.]
DRAAVVAAIKERAQQRRHGVENYLRAHGQPPGPLGVEAGAEGLIPSPPSGARYLGAQWITNSVTAEVTPAVLRALVERDDVVQVELVREIGWEDLLDRGNRTRPRRRARRATASDLNATPGAEPAVTGPQPRRQWSVKHINAHKLWDEGLRGNGVVVAVIDTGVNATHPDLRNRMWDETLQRPGTIRNLVERNNDTSDPDGHGTACAGIIAGDGTMGLETGVAPGARIMPIRARGEAGIQGAMQFAIDHGAHIISMSMSWPFREKPNYLFWRRICETVHAAGVVHVNSAGNEGSSTGSDGIPFNIGAPANCPPPWLHGLQTLRGGMSSAIACGACNRKNALSNQSGKGPAGWRTHPYIDYPYSLGNEMGLLKPDICAPGVGTQSCDARFSEADGGEAYTDFELTSAAAPHVSGCMALLVEACIRAKTDIRPERFLEAVETTAKRLLGQTSDKENSCGAGCIDVLAAFRYGADPQRKWWA